MRSTGEVMGVGETFGEALLKSQLGAGSRCRQAARCSSRVKNGDKPRAVEVARELVGWASSSWRPRGTAAAIARPASPVRAVNKVKEGRPHIVDMIKNGEIAAGLQHRRGKAHARSRTRDTSAARRCRTGPDYTTIAGREAAGEGMKSDRGSSAQELHAELH